MGGMGLAPSCEIGIRKLSQLAPLTLFERLLLGSKMNLQAASLCSPYAKVTIFSRVKF